MSNSISCPVCGRQQVATTPYCIQCGSLLPSLGTGMLPTNALLQGRYVIIDKLGQGGFGAVYRVADLRLVGTHWAVKEMSDALIVDPVEKARAVAAFQQEAQLLAQLAHHNIPKVTDYFTENNKHYIVMEFVPGETLEDHLVRLQAPCSEREVRLWAAQLCDVLAYLHSQNPSIIFRDLKPGNIMLTPQGQIKLVDFGIARLFKPGKASDTQVVGTPGFASPEQYGRGQTDGRSDVYSLGVVLHHLLTLHDPTTTPFALPPVRQLQPSVSLSMEQAIAKATQTAAASRFRDVREMQRALDTGVAGPPPFPQAPAGAGGKSRGVPVWVLLVLILGALGVGAALAGGIFTGETPPMPTVIVPTLPPPPTATEPPPLTSPPAEAPSEALAPTSAPAVAVEMPPTKTLPPPTRIVTPTPDWEAFRATITQVVDNYATDIKIQSTTYLDPSRLSEILIQPVLERQQQSVCWLKSQGDYYTYGNRKFEVESIEFDDKTHATLMARIGEDRVLRKQSGGVVQDYGHEVYRAIYELVRQGDRWYISCFQALLENAPVKCEVKIKTPSPCQ